MTIADPRSGRVAAYELAGFSVCEFALPRGYRMGLHAHSHSGLVLPLAGRFRAIASRRELDAVGDTVAILPGDAPHVECVGPEGASCLLVVPPKNRPLERSGLDLDHPASLDRPDLAATGALLHRELRATDRSAALIAEGLLLDLFAVSPTAPTMEWSAAPAWIHRVEELVRDRFSETLTHGEIAREVGVSREHLARTFRQFAGLPLGVFVRRIRLLRAARRLRDTRRPIAHIAAQCGFADQSHLSRLFRRHFEQSPTEYRARLGTGQRSHR
jgi:AraC family transcriptional regulator